MANKSRKCSHPGCSYTTHNPKAMTTHMENTGHNRTRKEVKYVQLGKMWKKVR